MVQHVGMMVPSDRCRRCGACIAVCPVKGVSMRENQVVVNECGACSDLGEGLCVASCSALADYDSLEERLFGRPRRFDEDFGIFRQALRAISLHPELRRRAYVGGSASTITYAALAEKAVDAAIISAWGDGEPWRPGPRIIQSPQNVTLGVGSKYFPSPNLRVLRDVKNAQNILFVGLPCHILALRQMQHSNHAKLRKLASRIKFILGVFCGIPALLTAEAFAKYLSHRGINLKHITHISNANVSIAQGLRSYRVHFNDQFVDIPAFRLLGELSNQRLRCDRSCFDYASELADVSVGGKMPPELSRHNLSNVLFVRTEPGEELVRIAQQSRLLHTQPLTRLGLAGLRFFPPYRRKRKQYLRTHKEKETIKP